MQAFVTGKKRDDEERRAYFSTNGQGSFVSETVVKSVNLNLFVHLSLSAWDVAKTSEKFAQKEHIITMVATKRASLPLPASYSQSSQACPTMEASKILKQND